LPRIDVRVEVVDAALSGTTRQAGETRSTNRCSAGLVSRSAGRTRTGASKR